jgi:hypothetical protein
MFLLCLLLNAAAPASLPWADNYDEHALGIDEEGQVIEGKHLRKMNSLELFTRLGRLDLVHKFQTRVRVKQGLYTSGFIAETVGLITFLVGQVAGTRAPCVQTNQAGACAQFNYTTRDVLVYGSLGVATGAAIVAIIGAALPFFDISLEEKAQAIETYNASLRMQAAVHRDGGGVTVMLSF